MCKMAGFGYFLIQFYYLGNCLVCVKNTFFPFAEVEAGESAESLILCLHLNSLIYRLWGQDKNSPRNLQMGRRKVAGFLAFGAGRNPRRKTMKKTSQSLKVSLSLSSSPETPQRLVPKRRALNQDAGRGVKLPDWTGAAEGKAKEARCQLGLKPSWGAGCQPFRPGNAFHLFCSYRWPHDPWREGKAVHSHRIQRQFPQPGFTQKGNGAFWLKLEHRRRWWVSPFLVGETHIGGLQFVFPMFPAVGKGRGPPQVLCLPGVYDKNTPFIGTANALQCFCLLFSMWPTWRPWNS